MGERSPRVPLGEVLRRTSETVTPEPDTTYQEVTVRLWGKGVVKRGAVSGAQLAGQRRFAVRAGQFILSRIDARNGAFGLVPPDLDGAVVSNDFPAFDVDRTRLDPDYLGWLSRTADFVAMCRGASEGTTNRVRLSEPKFLNLIMSLPSLPEQQRIVAQLNAVAEGLVARETAAKEADAELDAFLSIAFSRITEGAPRASMGIIAPLKRRSVPIRVGDNYPELGIRSFGKGTFHKPALSGAEVGSKRLFRIEPGDLLFSNVFAWEGAVAVAQPRDAGRVGSHRFITCAPEPSRATAQYLRYFFLTPVGLKLLGQASPGGAGRNRTLNLEALDAIEVPLPSLDAQRWFDRLQAAAAQVRAERAAASVEAATLLPALLRRTFA